MLLSCLNLWLTQLAEKKIIKSYTGGSLALSGGLFWTGNGSKYVTAESFTPESLLEWFEMRSETESNAPLVKNIANVAGKTFDYLIDNGAPWDVNSATETGLLAEQANSDLNEKWVIGLGWSHAMFIDMLV